MDLAVKWAWDVQKYGVGSDAPPPPPPPPPPPNPPPSPQEVVRQAQVSNPAFKPIMAETQGPPPGTPRQVKIIRGGRAMWVPYDSPEGREAVAAGTTIQKAQ